MATIKIDITGTDIRAGKTGIGAIILNALHQAGIFPVEVNCQDGDLVNKAKTFEKDPKEQEGFVVWFNTQQNKAELVDLNGNKPLSMEKGMKRYPALFKKEPEAGYTVTFRDVPEAITYGKTLEEARELALDALSTAFEFYKENGTAIPEPSKLQEGEELV